MREFIERVVVLAPDAFVLAIAIGQILVAIALAPGRDARLHAIASPPRLVRPTIMKIQRLLIVLTLLNLALLVFTLAGIRPAVADGVPPVLRGRALEIVDERGRVRASISLLPATTQPNGDTYSETVLLRLITERGRPSVKVGASEQAAGVSLAGPSNTKDTYVILEAKGTASSLRLRNEDGQERTVKP